MGMKQSKKPAPPGGDVACMNKRWPGSARFCRRWVRDYGFDCKLVLRNCENLKRQIELEIDDSPHRPKDKLQLQLEAANLWVLAAQERQNKIKEKYGGTTVVAALSKIQPDEESTISGCSVVESGRQEEKRQIRKEQQKERDRAAEEHTEEQPLDRDSLEDEQEEEREGRGKTRNRELARLQPYNLSPDRDGKGKKYPILDIPKTRSGTVASAPPPPPPPSTSFTHPPPPLHHQPPAYQINQAANYSDNDGHTSFLKPDTEDTLPLIQVANPHYGLNHPDGQQDRNRVVCVFRPWSDSEMKTACEGLTPFKQNVDQFCMDIQSLRESYLLNGSEMLRVWRHVFGHHWSRVRGNYSSTNVTGSTLPPGNELDTQVEAVLAEARRIWRPTIDYNRISTCKQNPKESVYEYRGRLEEVFKVNSGLGVEDGDHTPYQQQLKQALMNGFLPGIADFIRKHNVNHKTCSVQECLNYADQATEVFRKKREKGVTKLFVQEDESGAAVLYLNSSSNSAPKGNKGKGKGPHSKGKHEKGDNKGFRCYRCLKSGHTAKHCRTDWSEIDRSKSDKKRQPTKAKSDSGSEWEED